MGNRNLHKASQNKDDEFYTQLADVEKEVVHYKKHFEGKTVYLNCDDPRESNFFKYFLDNFEDLRLRRLISSCYKNQDYSLFNMSEKKEKAFWLEYSGEKYDSETPTIEAIEVNYFNGDGDFRSEESIELLKQADIVVTNPPFSLFREYIAQLIEYDKKFLIIGSLNAITYKEFFPLLQNNRVWLGYNSGDMAFKVPKYYKPRETRYWKDEEGQKWRSLGNIGWYTNLDIPKRHEYVVLYREYTPEKYPKYDNYDAINVDKVADIPKDYKGVMGVPITFVEKHNPEQFEVLGMTKTPICYENEPSAQRKKEYVNMIQISKTGKKCSGNKINDGSSIKLDEIPENSVYYTNENLSEILVAQYPRILIRNKQL